MAEGPMENEIERMGFGALCIVLALIVGTWAVVILAGYGLWRLLSRIL